jgi:type I restriction enzyme R subunit
VDGTFLLATDTDDRLAMLEAYMLSKNFEYLRPTWEDLADLGAFAEQYAIPDPQSAVAKLRTFAEQIVLFVYHKHGLPKPYQPNLNDLLTATTLVQAVPTVIVSKLHTLRIQGNKGAHGESVLPQSAVMLVQENTSSIWWLSSVHLPQGVSLWLLQCKVCAVRATLVWT